MNEREVGKNPQSPVVDPSVCPDGRDPDDAVLVAEVSWQYMTPEDQWQMICGRDNNA